MVSGTGTALAIATGPKTMFGELAMRLRTRAPETEFEHGLRRFSLLILRTTVVLVLFILLVIIAFKHDAFESLLFAVALGVGLTPEFLPMISSVTLTQGALRMARDQGSLNISRRFRTSAASTSCAATRRERLRQDRSRRDGRGAPIRTGWPARHPSPKKSPGPSIATTASLPVFDNTDSLTPLA